MWHSRQRNALVRRRSSVQVRSSAPVRKLLNSYNVLFESFSLYSTNIAKYAKLHKSTSKYQQHGCQIGCQKIRYKTNPPSYKTRTAVMLCCLIFLYNDHNYIITDISTEVNRIYRDILSAAVDSDFRCSLFKKSSKCVIISPKQSISPHFLRIAPPIYYLFTTGE